MRKDNYIYFFNLSVSLSPFIRGGRGVAHWAEKMSRMHVLG